MDTFLPLLVISLMVVRVATIVLRRRLAQRGTDNPMLELVGYLSGLIAILLGAFLVLRSLRVI